MTDDPDAHRGARRASRGWLVAAALAATSVIGVSSPVPASAAGQPVVVRDCSGRAQVRPAELTSIYCGVAGVLVLEIGWRRWDAAAASGTGIERRLTCVNAACRRRDLRVYPVGIRLSAPRADEFTWVTLTPRRGPAERYPLIGPILR